jgi:hypothetical protein
LVAQKGVERGIPREFEERDVTGPDLGVQEISQAQQGSRLGNHDARRHFELRQSLVALIAGPCELVAQGLFLRQRAVAPLRSPARRAQ